MAHVLSDKRLTRKLCLDVDDLVLRSVRRCVALGCAPFAAAATTMASVHKGSSMLSSL